jgi:hypothetical protein
MIHVTDILAECGFYQGFEHVPEHLREFYVQRGKMVHRATGLFDRDELDWDTLDERIVPYISAYEQFLAESGAVPLEIELAVQNDELGYCGTLDRIYKQSALWSTGELVVDIKTTQAAPVTRIQTMAYALALSNGKSTKPAKRGFVALKKDGTYDAGIYDKDEEDKAVWLACLQVVNWKKEHRQLGRKTLMRAREHVQGGA